MKKMAKEGVLYIILPAVGAAVFYALGLGWAGVPLILLCLVFAYFFRDPERIPPTDEGVFVSAADGEVMSVEELPHPDFGGRWKRVSVFMSPLNVHVNRAPDDAKLIKLEYRKGSFLPAYKPESIKNNKAIMLFENRRGENFIVELIAGVLARRVKCYIKEGDGVRRGERIGIIMLGSRVDLYIPPHYSLLVKKGDRVYAGKTIIAREASNEN